MKPYILENDVVQLRLIAHEDVKEILEAAKDPTIWVHMSDTLLTEEAVLQYVENAVREHESDQAYKLMIICKETGKIIGSTTLLIYHFSIND